MTPQQDALVRHIGAGVREAMAGHYVNIGPEFGYAVCRRLVAECAAEVTEVHGREAAFNMLTRAADRVVRGRDLDEAGAPHPLVEDEADKASAPAVKTSAKGVFIDLAAGRTTHPGLTEAEAIARLRKVATNMERANWPKWLRWLAEHVPLPPGWFVGWLVGWAMGAAR
jgi:hypothetical protein